MLSGMKLVCNCFQDSFCHWRSVLLACLLTYFFIHSIQVHGP